VFPGAPSRGFRGVVICHDQSIQSISCFTAPVCTTTRDGEEIDVSSHSRSLTNKKTTSGKGTEMRRTRQSFGTIVRLRNMNRESFCSVARGAGLDDKFALRGLRRVHGR
jgi:hypothetical protein